MLQNYITPSRIANAILQKTAYKGSYIIVEGKNDHTLYTKFTNEELCQIEIAFGNQNVIDVIEELNRRGYEKVIGIIDADFRILDSEQKPNNENIFLTDDHDLEIMLFKSKAFDTVISHYAIPEKIEAFKKASSGKSLREVMFQLASHIGYLKWANKRYNFGLVFKPAKQDGNPLPVSDFIPAKTLVFSGYEKMIEVVFNYSRQKTHIKVSPPDCLKATTSLIDDAIDLSQLCNGHDVATVVCLALRQKISNLNANALKPEELEHALVFSYDSRFFETTNLYKQIKQWEQSRNRTLLTF